MPARDLDAVFYSGDTPGVEYREGHFHVCYSIRNCYFEFVMPPHVFVTALVAAEEARAMWQLDMLDKSNVSQFRRKK